MCRLSHAALITLLCPVAATADDRPDLDTAVLAAHGLKAGDDALIAYLSGHTPKTIPPAEVDRLVRQLGAPAFADRESAQAALTQGGPVTADRLRAIPKPTDPEAAARVGKVIATVEAGWPPDRVAAYRTAVRVLARRAPAGAAECLLAALPLLAEDDLLGDAWQGLDRIAVTARVVPAPCAAAASDPDPDRRAFAAYLLGRRGTEAQREAAKRMLADPEPGVRLRAAQGLLGRGDTAGVPALIALLDQRPVTTAWQAEELLAWLAGADGPAAPVGDGKAAGRVKEAWEGWWARSGRGLDIAAVMRAPRRPSLFLVCQRNVHPGPSYLIGCDGRERWRPEPANERMVVHQILQSDVAVGVSFPWPPSRPATRPVFAPLLIELPIGSATPRREVNLAINGGGSNPPVVTRWLGGSTVIAGPNRFGCLTATGTTVSWTELAALTKQPPNPGRPQLDLPLMTRDGLIGYESGNRPGHERGDGVIVDPGSKQIIQQGHLSPDRVTWSDVLRLSTGARVLAEPARGRIIERDNNDQLVWEVAARDTSPVSVTRVFPVLRTGFDDPNTPRLDLNRELAARLAQLRAPDSAGRFLAAQAIRHDFGPRGLEAIPALLSAYGTELLRAACRDRTQWPQLPRELQSAITATGPRRVPIVAAKMEDQDPQIRVGAMIYTAGMGYANMGLDGAKWLDCVERAARDPSPLVRYWAYAILGNDPGEPRRMLPLLRNGLKDTEVLRPGSSVSVAGSAARSIGNFGASGRSMIKDLATATASADPVVAAASCESLVLIVRADQSAAGEVIPVLASISRNKARPEFRVVGASAMGRLGVATREALPHLLLLLDEETPPPGLRAQVYQAIANIGPAAASAVPSLIKALDRAAGEDETAQLLVAIQSIGTAAREASEPLASWARRSANTHLKILALRVAKSIGG